MEEKHNKVREMVTIMVEEDAERFISMLKPMLASAQYEVVASTLLKEALLSKVLMNHPTFSPLINDLVFYTSKHATKSER